MISGRKSFLFILLCFLISTSFAQLNSSIYHYSIAEGLSDNRIHSIIKDTRGFIWIGTWVGINRFDGHTFLTFKSNPGDNSNLKSNRIDEIIDDGKDALWLRAYDKQVYKFDKLSRQFLSIATILKNKNFDKVLFSRILEANDQRVWLRSEDGAIYLLEGVNTSKPAVRRYSGDERPPYRISSKKLAFAYPDKNGDIWVGSAAGLDLIERQKSGIYSTHTVKSAGKNLTHLSVIGNTVFSTTSAGAVVVLNKKTGYSKTTFVTKGVLNSIYPSPKGKKVYCTTSLGELFAISEHGTIEKINESRDAAPYFSVYEDRTGRLWIESGKSGVICLEAGSQRPEYVSLKSGIQYTSAVRNCNFLEDNQGLLWLSIRGKGFYYFNNESGKLVAFNYNKDRTASNIPERVNTLFYDPQGVVWLGTEGGGVKKIIIQSNDIKKTPFNFNTGIENENEVRGILTDKFNRVWAGTKTGTVFTFENRQIKPVEMGADRPRAGVYCFLQDRKGRIWFGTKGDGLFKLEPAAGTPNRPKITHYLPEAGDPVSISSNTIYSLYQDKKGRIWIGSYNDGLILIDETEGEIKFKTVANTFKHYPKGNYSRIRHLAEDAKGNIWIGTTDGLLIFNPNRGRPEDFRFSLYRKEPGNIKSLGGNDVQFIFRDSEQEMWVLSSSGGLNRAIGSDPLKALAFQNYSTKDGLPSDFLFSCIEDGNKNLWLTTQNGISRFSKREKRFRNFGTSYGLADVSFSEASCTKLQNGEIVLGTKNGLLQFHPDSIKSDKVVANMVFTGLQINSEPVMPGEQSVLHDDLNETQDLTLSHDQNILSIDFSLLDYRSAGKEEYEVRMLGLDDTWRSNDGQTRVTYTKLPPGKYVFEVRSDNPELYQTLPQKSLVITILPPPWKTVWAYLFYAFVAFILLLIAKRIAITMLKLKQTVEVERQVADLKLSFFTQVSHELRTPLSLIINPSEEILEKEKLSDKGTDYIKVVVKNARRMVRLVNQLLDLRKVESGQATLKIAELDLVGFCRSVVGYFDEVIERRKLIVEISPAAKEMLLWVDGEKVDIILYNLLANAIKFSPDGGYIGISIETDLSRQRCRIQVRDNGVGVAENELEKIFKLYYQSARDPLTTVKGTGIGLALSKELVELHGGKIYARTNSPTGLVVTLELPLGREHFKATNTIFIDSNQALEKVVSGDGVDWTPSIQETETEMAARQSVLIVEDNDDLRSFLASKLASIYQVMVAADGEEGLEKATVEMPDLILSDIMMPKMDGIQMLDKIKNNPALSHIPVVLLTARHSVASQIEGIRYGADFYITKPFDLELLEVTLRKFLKQRRQYFESISDHQIDEVKVPQQEQPSITIHDRNFLDKVIKIVEEKMEDSEFNVDDVADSIGMSRSAFFKKFKSLTNTAPVEFVRESRLKRAKQLFDEGEDNISTVAFAVGFNHPTYFSTCFKAQFQKTPREYLKSLKNDR